MATLFASLPAPVYSTEPEQEETTLKDAPTTQVLITREVIPIYGQRKNWRPTAQEHFQDGGSYPECHLAQYPQEMGRKKKTTSGNTLALQVDADGNVRYDAIAQQGHREGRTVQSQFKDLVPLAHRTDIQNPTMERPSEEDVQSTADRTKAALEKLVNGKIKSAQPTSVVASKGDVSYVRYTPGQQGGDGQKQRIIKMIQVVEDPLEPPKHKGKKIPRGPPSPPAPILRSPPRKVTAQEQKDWMIPPCVSNWKNNKGFTVPLDKRLAADGRGLQDVLINDRFAQFSEALYVADRHAREEVRQRSLMQQRIAQKEKESKEENLRMLAQRAREERSGIASGSGASRLAAAPSAGGIVGLAGYGSDESGSDEEEEEREEDEDVEGAKEREEIRRERKKDREREMRMSNMGTEQRAKILARATGRDISEKIALGLAKPTMSKDSMMDSRLFNQEQLSGSFGDDDSYGHFDKPLFSGSSAAAAIYRPRGANIDDDGNEVDAGNEDSINKSMQNDRFGLGQAGKGRGFDGADSGEIRDGPVAFEKDTADPFGVDAFLDEAKKGTKRGLNLAEESGRSKRTRD